MRVRLRLATERSARLRVGQICAVADRGPQPDQTPLGSGQQHLDLPLSQSPPPGLREEHGEEKRRLGGRAAGRQVWPTVPERSRNQSGTRPRAGELGAGEGPQGARGEAGAERQCHPGRGQCFRRRQPAAPGSPGREVRVRGMPGVAEQQGPEVLDTSTQERFRPGLVTQYPGLGERARRAEAHSPDRPLPVRPDAQFQGAGAARWQFELPAQQSRRGQGVRGRRVGGDGRVPRGAGPAQAGGVDGGRQFGSGPARGDVAEFREVRPEGDLDGQAQCARGRAAQRDQLGAVRMACSLDEHVRVRTGVGRGTQRAHEADPVGREHPGLDGERFPARDPDLATGQYAATRHVEALQPPAGQLSLLCGDHQPWQSHADQSGVGGWQVRRSARHGKGRPGKTGAAPSREGGRTGVPARARSRRGAPASDGLGGLAPGRTVVVGGRGRMGQGHGVASSALGAPGARWAPGGGSARSGASRGRDPATDSATQVNGAAPSGVTPLPQEADRMAVGPPAGPTGRSRTEAARADGAVAAGKLAGRRRRRRNAA